MLPGDKVGNRLESEISYMGLLPDVPGTFYFFYICKLRSFFFSSIFLRPYDTLCPILIFRNLTLFLFMLGSPLPSTRIEFAQIFDV